MCVINVNIPNIVKKSNDLVTGIFVRGVALLVVLEIRTHNNKVIKLF